MTVAIKPCPFCGGDAHAYEDDSSDYRSHWQWLVICDDKVNCWADSGYHDCKTEAEAIGWWNNRPIEDALCARVAELEHEILVGKIRGTMRIDKHPGRQSDVWLKGKKIA